MTNRNALVRLNIYKNESEQPPEFNYALKTFEQYSGKYPLFFLSLKQINEFIKA